MANYEYECTKCGKTFSVGMTFKEHDKHEQVVCPHCKSEATSQVITAAHVQTAKKS